MSYHLNFIYVVRSLIQLNLGFKVGYAALLNLTILSVLVWPACFAFGMQHQLSSEFTREHVAIAGNSQQEEQAVVTREARKKTVDESPEASTDSSDLDVITVTARRREENILDVPISVAQLAGQRFENRFSGGESILALAGAVPGLYIESSGGRTAPRLYLRGLGNPDFNQAASQPVSVMFDGVPVEKSGLRGFPLFDIANVEVIRGPQGSLFGRNTTAGVVRFESRRPSENPEGRIEISRGELGTWNAEGAVGGPLIGETLAGRAAFLYQDRRNWIDNGFTGVNNVIGGFEQLGARVQLAWNPVDSLSTLLLYQESELRGNSQTPFRANIIGPGNNNLNANFIRDTVFFDGGGNLVSKSDNSGATLQVDWDISKYHTLTAISSYQDADRVARADVDGGFGAGFAGIPNGPGFIPFPVDTASDSTIDQFTGELRLESNFSERLNYQIGFFYFDDRLDFIDLNSVETATPKIVGIGIRSQSIVDNEAWAVFGQGSYAIRDRWDFTLGLRYTEDQKTARFSAPPGSSIIDLIDEVDPISVNDEEISWDAALSYEVGRASSIYTRVAKGFRAPTIQTTVREDPDVTTADSETILSYEIGYKGKVMDLIRLNFAGFYYEVDDIQITAVGGGNQEGGVRLFNANKGIGYGAELDFEYAPMNNVRFTGGFGYNETEYREDGLATSICFSCTVTDRINSEGLAVIDGNRFQQTPLWTLNLELDLRYPLSPSGDLFFFTDWRVLGETNFFLFESKEFNTDRQFEGGVRFGYRNVPQEFEIALFGRNITDEENLVGGIDFNNLTGLVNEPRIIGIDLLKRF